MSALMHFYERQKKRKEEIAPYMDAEVKPAATRIIETARQEGRTSLLEPEAMHLLHAYDLPIPPGEFADSADNAVKVAQKIGFPVVLKVVSQDIIHKSDAGGVKVGLADEQAVRKAYETIMANALKVTEQSRVQGVLVTQMAAKGQECIVGMTADPIFGPVVMFGLGGVFVEVLKDVAFRVAPVTPDEVAEMVAEIKGFKVLTGIRGEPSKDIEAVKEVIQKLSDVALAHPEIKEIDLNPVIVHEKGISLVDSRIIIE
jgi:acyl-CoA synthetase (NDP forming)